MFHPAPAARHQTAAGLLARAGQGLMAVLRTIAEAPARRAVVNELSTLSDRELADIGLARSEVRRVFDDAFVASRSGI
ncbi:MAG: DUF1127 domain-containing protein [Acidisphaera sp.]|nr:DUF1127 domain-containing protein [Acidisphaera sp.]